MIKNNFSKNKKAQISFLPYLLVGLVFAAVLGIFAIATTHVGDKVFDELTENEYINSSNKSVQSVTQVKQLMTKASDQLVFFLLGAVLLGFVALAIFSDFHPIFMGIFVLFIIVMVVLGGILANSIDEVRETDILKDKASEFTLTNKVFGQSLPILIAVFGAIGIIILLAKRGKVTSPV